MEMKHAYLIMAHNNFESLKYLLKAIDDDRNDIYLHIDKKTSYVDLEEIRTWVTKAGLFFAPRIKVFWGHFSVVQCELNLLRMATSKGKYHYYHFLSGVDYPIKSQDEIHECLKDCNKEFVTYHENGTAGDIFDYKIRYYYPFMKWVQRGHHEGPGKKKALLRLITRCSWRVLEKQKQKNVDRRKRYPQINFVKGDNWCSITDDLARYILSKEQLIKKMFRWTNTPDEFFVATIAVNSEFKERIATEKIRLIDWQRGNPYEFVYTDLNELKHSDEFFARKISYVKEPELVRSLEEHIGVRNVEVKNTHPLISIVVPIYNVENYLAMCLASIAAQTYKNLQVLLIDDGSIDGSTEIAKDYAARDDRFVYLHQENKGLSGARNTGIDNARGEYIAFVDSDDWLEPDYIQELLRVALERDSDITIGGLFKEAGNSKKVVPDVGRAYSKTAAMEILDDIFPEKYMLMILAWNKLYKRKLFETIRFPQGKIHEDEYTIHRLIDESELIYTVPKSLYHYRMRQDSITGANTTEDLRHFHIMDAHLDRVECCKRQSYGAYYELIVYSMFEELIELICRYSDEAYKKFKLNGRFRRIMFREYFKNYSQLCGYQRKEYILVMLSPRAYKYRKLRINAQKMAS